jgi:hypothetical protein
MSVVDVTGFLCSPRSRLNRGERGMLRQLICTWQAKKRRSSLACDQGAGAKGGTRTFPRSCKPGHGLPAQSPFAPKQGAGCKRGGMPLRDSGTNPVQAQTGGMVLRQRGLRQRGLRQRGLGCFVVGVATVRARGCAAVLSPVRTR